MAVTASLVNMIVANNTTWEDAFQFGTVGDLTWNFTGQTFKMDIRATADDVSPLLSLTSGGGTIVIDDPIGRTLHLLVSSTVFKPVLPVGTYVYDLIMLDGSTPPVRVALMTGTIQITQGVTG